MSKKNQDNKPQGDFAFPKEWTLFGPVGQADPEPDLAGMTAVPEELTVAGKKLAAQEAAFTDNRLDLGALLGGKDIGKTAYLLAVIEADKATEVELGAGADWWMNFGGDSVPAMGPGGGWSVGHALLFGCEPHFAPSTVWTDPLPAGADGYPPIRFDREGRWWKWLREGTRQAAQASRGRWFVWPAWGNEAGDILSLIRGDMNLLVDIAENPDWVRQAVKQVSDSLIEVFEELWTLVDASVTGFEGSMAGAIWSPGRGKEFSCDISCNISTKQFEELFLPAHIETMRTVDHRYYHLDGTVALHHLDLLLSVPEIQAIQWVPGAGREAILQWVPLIKRIQQAGKAVQVFCQPQEVAPLLNEVSARGLCIVTGCGSEAEARELERQVAKLSRER